MMSFNKVPPPLDLKFDINSTLYLQEVEKSQKYFSEISEKFQFCISNQKSNLEDTKCSELLLDSGKTHIEYLNTKFQQFFLF